MPITDSPLRYPGGKSKLKLNVESIIRNNNLVGCTYVEPFAGGSAVALHLLFSNTVQRIIINDFDISIYAFWHSVVNRNDELCAMILQTDVTMEQWYIQKNIQEEKSNTSNLLLLGFSTFFLNRTNRSGIIKAGVMGGYEQQGNYKMDCRYNKVDLVNKIKKIGEYRDRIDLYNLDTVELVNNVVNHLPQNTFIFFDPPYYMKGQSLYVNFYQHQDHLELAESISHIENLKWIVSYDNVDEIKEMYNQFRHIEYGLSYTVQNKYEGKEVMFFSDNLNSLIEI